MTGPQTIAEKILSSKSGRTVRAGELTVCDVDWIVGTDASAPMAIDYFEQMGGTAVVDPARVIFSLDHYDPASRPKTAAFHERVRRFAELTGVGVFGAAEGISHQILMERALVRPGQLLVGADSHSVTCGALNAFAVGVGSSELAAAMLTGQLWFRVPESVRVTLTGVRPSALSAKDIALALVGQFGSDGANYQSLEFDGMGIVQLSMDDRMVIASLAVEMGAKAALFPFDDIADGYIRRADIELDRRNTSDQGVRSDPGAEFARVVELDLEALSPRIALPHAPDHVVPLGRAAGTPIHMVFIGTCTGGRVSDFHDALGALQRAGGRTAPGVSLVLTPASAAVLRQLRLDGTLAAFERLGAVVTLPGCGACCGTSGVIPTDGMNVISTANRNFKGRMGNRTASIYLASPAACGTAAATGYISGKL